MSLSCSVFALASVVNFFVCVCPAVPTLPKVTVKDLPFSSMFQNLCDLASEYVNVRMDTPGEDSWARREILASRPVLCKEGSDRSRFPSARDGSRIVRAAQRPGRPTEAREIPTARPDLRKAHGRAGSWRS